MNIEERIGKYLNEKTRENAWEYTQKEILELMKEYSQKRKKYRNFPVWKKQEDYYEKDEKGNDIVVYTDEYKKVKDSFYDIESKMIKLMQLKGTKYNKYSTVKQMDSQQQLSKLSDERVKKRHYLITKYAFETGKNVPKKVLKDYQDLK